MITANGTSLLYKKGTEKLCVTAWGRGLRVTAVPYGEIPTDEMLPEISALDPVAATDVVVFVPENGEGVAYIENSGIRCEIRDGRVCFSANGKELLEELDYAWPLHVNPRQYRPIMGTDGFEVRLDFKAYDDEVLHGMGQYRNGRYDMKGTSLELFHRNSQISMPFLLSNRGYGFLWNNPAVGEVMFGTNRTGWKANSTKRVDYWICAGDTPAEIIEKYTEVTGRASELPEDLLGLWQCKLRYRTQDELMAVAREYHRRGIPLDVIVIDFFHWLYQGDWSFDPRFWPDPQGMVDELTAMGTKLMVSIWPTVEEASENYKAFNDNGYLVSTDRGVPVGLLCFAHDRIYDATNPDARKFAYDLIRKNYGQYGIELFWLDEAEPELQLYDHDLFRYYLGPASQVANVYPKMHTRMTYEGLLEDGVKAPMALLRCAWIGSQKYGALVWSGDIDSTFAQMKRQVWNGINMGTAGIPYWISDTGGFYGGNINDPTFKELLVRWYQWAVFTPVLRMHGDRQPNIGSLAKDGNGIGGACVPSGADNEIWSYGEENYEIFMKYLKIRHDMKPYIKKIADESRVNGLPMIRGMYLEFPDDATCWSVDDQYMFGSDYLVAPVTDMGARSRKVYLPAGTWEAMDGSGIVESKGEFVVANAPIDYMPVYKRV